MILLLIFHALLQNHQKLRSKRRIIVFLLTLSLPNLSWGPRFPFLQKGLQRPSQGPITLSAR